MYRGLRDAQSKLQLIRTLEYTQEKCEGIVVSLKPKPILTVLEQGL